MAPLLNSSRKRMTLVDTVLGSIGMLTFLPLRTPWHAVFSPPQQFAFRVFSLRPVEEHGYDHFS